MRRSYNNHIVLSESWIFRFSSLAFIVLGTPALAVFFHGLVGFFPLLLLALFAGLLQNKFNLVLRLISLGISKNKLFFVFSLWYFLGFVANSLFRGGGLDDWRLMMSPLLIMIAALYTFAFMHDDLCYRYFQIAFILILGLNYAYAVPVMIQNPDIARRMWVETTGVWIYGNQVFYAINAIILPILIWRSISESGLKRLLLVLSCICIFITFYISSFATPVGLIALSIPIIIFLSIFLNKSLKNSIRSLFILGIILISGFAIYNYTKDSSLTAQSISRLNNFIVDPQSGGYNQSDALIGSRWIIDQISIQSFKSEPLFGVGGRTNYNPFMGGHSSFFDSLAILGLLGGGGALCGMIIMLVVNGFRRLWHERTWEALVILTAFLLLLVAGIVNPYWQGPLPFVLLIARPFTNLNRVD